MLGMNSLLSIHNRELEGGQEGRIDDAFTTLSRYGPCHHEQRLPLQFTNFLVTMTLLPHLAHRKHASLTALTRTTRTSFPFTHTKDARCFSVRAALHFGSASALGGTLHH
jgi:hypothetical protein